MKIIGTMKCIQNKLSTRIIQRHITLNKEILYFLCGTLIGLLISLNCIKIKDETVFLDEDAFTRYINVTKNRALDEVAKDIETDILVLCWVMENSKHNSTSAAKHIKNTWGRRCNKLLFTSSVEDSGLENIVLTANKDDLWAKTKESLLYIYKNHLYDADWFLIVGENSYVIMENLRYRLYSYSTNEPIYFGYKFKANYIKQGYMSGNPGYVLSKEALVRFVETALDDKKNCAQLPTGQEDKNLGKCLAMVDVRAGDSRDVNGYETFLPFPPRKLFIPNNNNLDKLNGHDSSFYKIKSGISCCSDYAIAFNQIHPNFMYLLEYLIYNLNIYGILSYFSEIPTKTDLN